MWRVLTLYIFLQALTINCFSQAIDNMSSFRMLPAKSYFRLNYDNDYFTATDYYYTQGINFEVVAPAYRSFFLARILYTGKQGDSQHGISIEHNGYTPTSISSDQILYGDRPFAAALMFKTFAMTDRPATRDRITSSFTLGIIGPAAGGYEMQREIHARIHATTPMGWQYQIANDIVLNYEIGYEKNLAHARDIFLINSLGTLHAGTLSTKATVGAVVMFGRLNSKILSTFDGTGTAFNPTKKLRFHAYAQPMFNVIGYDATLQGGVFNHSSPYTIATGDISRITGQINYGVVVTFNSMYLEYYKAVITKEWQTGIMHHWGGIRVGVKL
jgi:lipid A 3-O-deacylase